MPPNRRFDDVLEGDELGPVTRFLSKEEVRAYARASEIYFPRFTDDEGARQEGLPGMITPGNMSMGLLGTLIDGWAGPGGLERLGTTFRGLVLPGAHDPPVRRRDAEGRGHPNGGARRLARERRGRAAGGRYGVGRAGMNVRYRLVFASIARL